MRHPNRDQVTPVPAWIDELLPDDHLARLIWEVTGQLDLRFLAHLVVTEDGPGRAAADPRLLVALWLYATSQGVTNARELARLEAALQEMPKVRAAKEKGKEEQARVSSTDPQARVMKMADGGFRPAYNILLASDTAERVIVGVAVSNEGSDMALMPPMVRQVEEQCKNLPKDWLMDGGFASIRAIETGAAKGMRVLSPVQTPRDPDRDPHAPRPGDLAVAAWRERMGTQEAKDTYKLRASSIELVNAQALVRHGLQQLRVRGRLRVLCAVLIAITHNLLIWLRHLQSVGLPRLATA